LFTCRFRRWKRDKSVQQCTYFLVILSKLFSYFVSFIPNYRLGNSKRPSNRSPCTVTNAIVASTPAALPRPTSSQTLSITPSVKMRRVIEPQVSEISSSDQEIRQMYVFEILYWYSYQIFELNDTCSFKIFLHIWTKMCHKEHIFPYCILCAYSYVTLWWSIQYTGKYVQSLLLVYCAAGVDATIAFVTVQGLLLEGRLLLPSL
jgi:hypothetical protein